MADLQHIAEDGKPVIEDTKGFKTALYRLKFELFHARWPDVRITEL